jgi:hypothetical protein
VQPDGGGYRVTATLANTGTGTADVTVRVEGKKQPMISRQPQQMW